MLIHMVEQLTAVLCGYYQILHPCTELAGQVYSRLYGEYHVGLHGVGIYGAYIALFVVFHAYEVAQPVGKVLSVACGGDMVAGLGVYIAEAHARTYELLRLLVGLAHQIMYGCILWISFLPEVGAGHIGAVVILPAAYVYYYAVAFLYHGPIR